jgi:hypothetical protein
VEIQNSQISTYSVTLRLALNEHKPYQFYLYQINHLHVKKKIGFLPLNFPESPYPAHRIVYPLISLGIRCVSAIAVQRLESCRFFTFAPYPPDTLFLFDAAVKALLFGLF